MYESWRYTQASPGNIVIIYNAIWIKRYIQGFCDGMYNYNAIRCLCMNHEDTHKLHLEILQQLCYARKAAAEAIIALSFSNTIQQHWGKVKITIIHLHI